MKPFDLQEALNGAPVKLRNGQKAYVVGLSKVGPEDGNSYIVGEFGRNLCNWSKDGKYWLKRESEFDIVGMLEDPELTSEQVLEKAYQENLPLDAIGKKAFVIAKTKDGDYVMQCGEDNLYFASNETEWKFYKDPAPKSDTITVTLPKPFKPKQGDPFYYLTKIEGDFIRVKYAPSFRSDNPFDTGNSSRGNCFRAESDAQAWLDAMKGALK